MISGFQESAGKMGEEGKALSAEVKTFLDQVRTDLAKPCSGRDHTQNVQTLNLSVLRGGTKKENADQLVGEALVTRNEKSCEVHLYVQHASSKEKLGDSQSVVHLDSAGKIIASESPASVDKCLALRGRL